MSSADVAKGVAVAKSAIADAIEFASWCLDDEAGPERMSAIPQATCGPVQRWLEMDAGLMAECNGCAPIVGFGHSVGNIRFDDRIVAKCEPACNFAPYSG